MDEKALERAYETLGRPDHAGDRLTVRAAITAYLQASEGWRDIESAPKDGTNILLAHDHAVFDGYWDKYADGWVDDVTDLYEDKITYPATHWRPLPEPPKSTAGER